MIKLSMPFNVFYTGYVLEKRILWLQYLHGTLSARVLLALALLLKYNASL